jgi:hypothetical protein
LFFSGRPQEAVAPLERGLTLAQQLGLRDAIPHAMHRLALVHSIHGRVDEARALYEEAIRLAELVGRSDELLAAQTNSSDLMLRYDAPGVIERSLAALATARRLGNQAWESVAGANAIAAWTLLGRWDELDRLDAELIPADGTERPDADFVHTLAIEPALLRGDVAEARARHARCTAFGTGGEETESRQSYEVARGLIMAASGEEEDGFAVLMRTLRFAYEALGPSAEALRFGVAHTYDLALRLGRLDDLAALLALDDGRHPGEIAPFRQAQRQRAGSLLAAARGEHDTVEAGLRAAIDSFEQLGYVYWLAHARIDLAEWLLDRGRAAEAFPLLDLAEAALTSLRARPALERCAALRAAQPAQV